MNSRLKGFGFGKRKSTVSIQTTDAVPPASAPPPGQIPQHQIPHPGQTTPIGASSSQSSLAMNRPPSYTSNYPPGLPGGPGDRTSPHQGNNRTPPSQIAGGPPPINTGAPAGYPPPNMAPMGQGPPPPGFGGQPGYRPGPPLSQGGPIAQQFQRPNPAAEVEGASKSKAQLIVGIDFVSIVPGAEGSTVNRSRTTYSVLQLGGYTAQGSAANDQRTAADTC